VLLVCLVWPKSYTASASVVIDVKSPDPIAGMIIPGLNAPAYMTTQLEVVRSDRVARSVVKALKLDEVPQVREDWMEATEGKGDMVAWLAEGIVRKLDVVPSRETNVINISYSARDPNFAAAMTNAFMKAYIEVTAELRSEPARQYATMFEGQSKTLREQLEKAQSRLSAFQTANGLLDTNERFDVENARLNELSTQLVTIQAMAAESASRKAQSGANATEVLNNPVVANLKAELARQDSRYKELSARYGSAHPQVQEAQATVTDLRAKVEIETSRVTSSLSINNSVNVSREAQVRAALDAQRQKLLKLKELRDQASVLTRDVENAQRAYDQVQQRFSQTTLESQSTQTNVSPLKVATPPVLPSSPKVLINVIVGLLLGTSLAVGACLFAESRDRRVRNPHDVADRLRLPVMATIPRHDVPNMVMRPRQAKLAMRRKALPELPKPSP
jgi:succinoglycan biosynthesis transport protein ExoP